MKLPNFERNRWEGQLDPEERQLLYETVMERKPVFVYEVGTCRGGGSTYFIAQALANLEMGGVVYSTETNHEFHEHATQLYEHGAMRDLGQHVVLFEGDACQVLRKLLMHSVDMFMLDGSEDAVEALYQWAMFREHSSVGTVAAFHDWGDTKSVLVKSVIERDKDWRLVKQVNTLAVFERVSEVYA